MRCHFFSLLPFILGLMLTCADHDRRSESLEPVKPSAESASQKSQEDAPNAPPAAENVAAANAVDDCKVYSGFKKGQPAFLKDVGAIVTRMNQPCTTKDGQEGFKKGAGWMAMGFPCTAGDGRIDWKGTNYARPKIVSFLLETSCPMAPRDKTQLQAAAQKNLGFGTDSPLLALTPFMVQYWEIQDFSEADVGLAVDLRSGRSLDQAWKNLRADQPLKVLLVGRENAWVDSDFLYAVDAEIRITAKNRFQLRVANVRILSGNELQAVKGRCEALRPERDCQRVF